VKTIEIQNCTDSRDKFFKVFINGEKHAMRFLLRTQVADDKPFQVKVKYFWRVSRVYTFEPKDNMKLQVFVSQRWNKTMNLFVVGWLLSFAGRFFFGKYFMEIGQCVTLLIMAMYYFSRKEKSFVIREFSEIGKVA
jgi:hypothetical protein